MVVSGLCYCVVVSRQLLCGGQWTGLLCGGLDYCVVDWVTVYGQWTRLVSGGLGYCVVVSGLAYCVAVFQSLSKDNLFKD